MAQNKSSIFTIDFTTYKERVALAAARIKGMYWGAQVDCAEAIGRQPITVSQVLRGIVIDEGLLESIEGWLAIRPGSVPQAPPPSTVEQVDDAAA